MIIRQIIKCKSYYLNCPSIFSLQNNIYLSVTDSIIERPSFLEFFGQNLMKEQTQTHLDPSQISLAKLLYSTNVDGSGWMIKLVS